MKDKIVLITGASSGIGQACAMKFAELGANLILLARRADRLSILKKELEIKYQISIHTIDADIRDKGKVENAINTLPCEFTEIDVLINNAGLSRSLDRLHEGSICEWEEMIDTNVKGLLYISRFVIPDMVQRNKGHIINLGSIAGHQTYPRGNVYCATKAAVKVLSEGMKMDLLGTNIRVTSIDPGMVETEFSLIRFQGDQDRAKSVYAGLKPLTAEDIADAIVYAASCPVHVNISQMIIMPTAQASATLSFRE